MYAKLFASLYQGTLRGCSDSILVFTNLLAHADKHGIVDKHYRAIAEETGISEDRVRAAIEHLESPDPESRSPELDGRRIVPIDEHRAWGWQIVNHGKYRAIKNEDDRREQNRIAQEKWREKQNKQRKPRVSKRKQDKPIQIQITDKEEELREASASPPDRKHHPAIVALHAVVGIYPPSEIWDELIDRLGTEIDTVKLKKAFTAWRVRGYNKVNYDWTEWYHEGIPKVGKGNATNNRNGRADRQTSTDRLRDTADILGKYPTEAELRENGGDAHGPK